MHDYFGPGRHAKIVSTKAADLLSDGNKYRQEPPLTGDESVVAEVTDVDVARAARPGGRPAAGDGHHAVRREGGKLRVTGISHDNGEIASVTVNGQPAKIASQTAGVADWRIELPAPRVAS